MDPLVPTDPPEVEAILWSAWKGDLAFDVGGHYGENIDHLEGCGFTRIIAMEPQPAAFDALAARFGERCTALNLAVSDHDGTVELATAPGAESKGEYVTPGTDGMEWSPADWAEVPTLAIPCRTLDGLAEEYGLPQFIVVDVEGHEVHVLEGGSGLLTVGKMDALIEFHSPANRRTCISMLEDFGYQVQVVRHPHYRPYSPMWHQHGWLRAVAPNGPQS